MGVIDQIYKLRQDFMVIGLTGRTGSGCSTVAGVLAESDFTKLKSEYKEFRSGIIDNNVRKNRIVYNFMKEHWRPFTIIKASDVIFYFALLLDDFDKFRDNLFCASESDKVNSDSKELIAKGIRENIGDLSDVFNKLHNNALECDDYLNSKKYRSDLTKIDLYKQLLLKLIPDFRDKLDGKIEQTFKRVLGKDLQRWGNNIRNYDSIVCGNSINKKSPACLAHKINQFIKMFRVKDKAENNPTLIVVDALRNPYEILYFRERYSAFYTMSVNTEDSIRKNNLALKGY